MFARRRRPRPSPRTSRAPSRSTRAATCGCSASRSATVDTVTPSGTDVEVDDDVRRRGRDPRRRQGRDHRAVDRRRPLRPAHAGLHRAARCWPTAPSSTRTGPRCRSSSTRSTPASTTSPSRSARPAPTRTAPCPTCWRRPPTTSAARARSFHQTIKDFGRLSATLDDNKEELFGSAARARGLHRDARRQRPDGARLQPVAGRRLHDARGRARGARRPSLRNLATRSTQVSTFVKENKAIAGPQHHRPQPGRQGAGQAARRPRRDPRRRPRWRSTTSR